MGTQPIAKHTRMQTNVKIFANAPRRIKNYFETKNCKHDEF